MRWLLTFFWAVCLTTPHPARAQVPTDTVRRFVQNELGQIEGASRVDISVGSADSRLQLAPCERAEPFLRSGTRLWGRTFVGLRCAAGAQWTISVPVQVRVYGPALIAVHRLPSGHPISEAEVRIDEVEWTREPQGVVREVSQLQRRVLSHPVDAGQAIGLAQLSDMAAVNLGDPVKLVGQGRGFSITTDAIALASAAEGQPIRARLESGKILTGTARDGRIVEVSF
jgi:flagellar basal body P-ring formation protein FlgA